MLATSITAAVLGVEAQLVRVEADIASGFPRFTMVGLPDSAVKESEARIRAAVRNCGLDFKWDRRVTVNLAPASLRKYGSAFDLATALGLLAADGMRPLPGLDRVLLAGELALDGALRGVPGVLPMLLLARRRGIPAAIVPRSNHAEAALVPDLRIYPADSLADALTILGGDVLPPAPGPPPRSASARTAPDLADVRGQLLARRALEIAAAGAHNLLLVGPPGSGKTMLARRLPGLLPPLSPEEALEVAAIHSAAGLDADAVAAERPFRSPHHTASAVAIVGGGHRPRPGEVTLAHRGVLFLDELPEFDRTALEVLRQPLEEGFVTVSRNRGTLRLPARFQFVGAMNLCPCGHAGSASPCRCTAKEVRRYLHRLSGPLLDRVDLFASTAALDFDELCAPPGEPTSAVRARVLAARARRQLRATGSGARDERQHGLAPAADAQALVRRALASGGLTARGYDRLLRVSRTIADLAGSEQTRADHLAEALQFRRAIDSVGSAPSDFLENSR